MWWLVTAAIVVIVIFLAFKFRKFGKILLGSIVVLVVIWAIYYFNEQQEEKTSKKRIAPNEIELVDLQLQPTYGSYKLVGRVKNKSVKYTLTELRVKSTMRDVIPNSQSEIVGETVTWMYKDIPPMQTREINEYVSFTSMPQAKGVYEWGYEIVEIKGKQR